MVSVPAGRYVWRSIRARMLLLVLGGMLPLLLLAALSAYESYRQGRAAAEDRALDTARAIALAVDRELAARIEALQVLARAEPLARGDLDAFRARAEEFLAAQPPGSDLLVSDAAGRPAAPHVSGLPEIGVHVPVPRDGAVVQELTLTLPGDWWARLLDEQRLPHGWSAAILGRDGRRIAGSPAAQDFERAGRYGWTVRLGVPAAANGSWQATAGIGLALLLAGIAAALFFARSIEAPVAGLARWAAGAVRDPAQAPRTGIAELEELAEAIGASAASLREARAAAETAAQRFSSLVLSLSAVVWTKGPDGSFVEPQSSWQTFTGQPWKRQAGFGWVEAVHPEDRARVVAVTQEAIAQRRPYRAEGRIWHEPSGTYRDVVARGVPIVGAAGELVEWVGNISDVTELKRAEARRDLLQREIDHRTKNNLQIVSSLLAVQAQAIADPALRAQFDGARDRIATVALVHSRLQQLGAVGAAELDRFLHDLCGEIARATGTECRVIADPMSVPPDLLQPLALIVNELITNAAKYAYRGGARAEVVVACHIDRENRLVLAIADRGVGLPADFATRRQGLGMRVVHALTGQIGGTLTVADNAPGARFVITVPLGRGAQDAGRASA